MITLTAAQVAAVAPLCKDPAGTASCLNAAMKRFTIAQDVDFVRAFVAQLAVESGQFNHTRENMNYSAVGLMQTWPTRFPTLDIAKFYERQPQKIANHVYANRLGNGDEASGDGWKNRGVGWIQATGATNINRALVELGFAPGDPTPLETPIWAAMSAGAYWARKPQLNALADDLPHDDDAADFFSISRIVNGGTIGLNERRAFWARTKTVIV